MKASYATGTLILRAKGEVGIPVDDIVRHHPEVTSLFDEIVRHKWSWTTSHTTGQYTMEMKIVDAPCVVGEMEHGSTHDKKKISAVLDIGYEEPKLKDVESVDSFRVSVATPACWRAVTLDYFSNEILEVRSILWEANRLELSEPQQKEVVEAYEVLEWALRKGYKLGKDYPAEQMEAVAAKVKALKASFH